MKIEYVSPNGRIKLAWEAQGVKGMVESVSSIVEVLEGDTECGQCGSKNIGLEHRKAQDYDFYGMKCHSCGGRLNFGQSKDGKNLFVKRDAGKHGWEPRYTKSEGGQSQSEHNPTPQKRTESSNAPAQPVVDDSSIPF